MGVDIHELIQELEWYQKNQIPDIQPEYLDDIITVLKAQEPVEPVIDIDTWKCGNCGHTLEHQELLGDNVLFHEQYDYCPICGRAVKWK